jgi:hypothetical protein
VCFDLQNCCFKELCSINVIEFPVLKVMLLSSGCLLLPGIAFAWQASFTGSWAVQASPPCLCMRSASHTFTLGLQPCGKPTRSPCLAGGVAQVVEHLLRKCKALSSSSSTAKKKKKSLSVFGCYCCSGVLFCFLFCFSLVLGLNSGPQSLEPLHQPHKGLS